MKKLVLILSFFILAEKGAFAIRSFDEAITRDSAKERLAPFTIPITLALESESFWADANGPYQACAIQFENRKEKYKFPTDTVNVGPIYVGYKKAQFKNIYRLFCVYESASSQKCPGVGDYEVNSANNDVLFRINYSTEYWFTEKDASAAFIKFYGDRAQYRKPASVKTTSLKKK
jgi:hypothetical protein